MFTEVLFIIDKKWQQPKCASTDRWINKTTEKTQVQSLGWEDPLEKEMATHSSILAWEIPWTKELGRLQSMGLQSQAQLSDSTTTITL